MLCRYSHTFAVLEINYLYNIISYNDKVACAKAVLDIV